MVELPNGPSGTPGNWLFWGAYVVNAKTAHPEEAWKLVQALTTAETQGKVAALGANIPSRVSKEALDAFLTFTPPANNQAFLNGIAEAAKPTAEELEAAAAAEAALDAKSANTEWTPLFLKGTPFVLAGSVISRQMTKIA